MSKSQERKRKSHGAAFLTHDSKLMTLTKKQSGFTIIELMVATAVFAVLLLVITFGILQISRVYYKGITESNTQNAARSIMDLMTQSIQFSGGDVMTTTSSPETPQAFCIGNEQFSYVSGMQLVESSESRGDNQTYHSIVQNTVAGCADPDPPAGLITSPDVPGRELLAPNMRLANLNIDLIEPGLYRVEVRVVYGDDDLLTNPTGQDATCISETSGTQFCAVSELSTIVRKRVQ